MENPTLTCPICQTQYECTTYRVCPRDGAPLRTADGVDVGWSGQVIQKRYLVGQLLGAGGMAQVYEGEHLATERKVAIKVVQPRLVSDPAMVERFRQEAQMLALIAHPNVVAVEDFGTLPDGALFMVMELLRGESLHDVLKRDTLDPLVALDIAAQLCEAVQAAHDRNIVHRDIKPGNVHLQRAAGDTTGGVEVKVLDFGIAKMLFAGGGSDLTKAGAVFGTAEYMSPEQAMGKPAEFSSDIYSIGVLLYRMLTGRVPFAAESYLGVLVKQMSDAAVWPEELPTTTGLPPEVRNIVMKSLEKETANRYPSAAAFGAAITDLRKRMESSRPARAVTVDSLRVVEPVPSSRTAGYRVSAPQRAVGGDEEVVEIVPGVYWVGRRVGARLECNSYLRVYRSEGTQLAVLVDPGPPRDLDVIGAKIASVIGSVSHVDFMFINHQDPDVSGNAVAIQQVNPTAHVLCSEDTWRLIHSNGLKPQCYSAVEHFRDLRMRMITGHDVVFVPTPYCHFRGAVMYYDVDSRVLFSGDLFGGLSHDRSLMSLAPEWDDVDVFHQLYMPTGRAVRRAIERVRALDPPPLLIAPQHGALIPSTQIESLLAHLERLPVGLDLEPRGTDAERYRDALNDVIAGLALVAGSEVVRSSVARFADDGTFPGLLAFEDKMFVSRIKLDPLTAARSFLHDLAKALPKNLRPRLALLVDQAEQDHAVRMQDPAFLER